MPPKFTSRINVNFEKQKLFAISSASGAAQHCPAHIAICCPAVKKAETALLENHGHWLCPALFRVVDSGTDSQFA